MTTEIQICRLQAIVLIKCDLFKFKQYFAESDGLPLNPDAQQEQTSSKLHWHSRKHQLAHPDTYYCPNPFLHLQTSQKFVDGNQGLFHILPTFE